MSAEVTLKFSTAKELFETLSKISNAEFTFQDILERIDSMSGSMAEQLAVLQANASRLDALDTRVQEFRDAVPGLIQAAVEAARAEGATPEQIAAFAQLNATITAELDELAGNVAPQVPPGELPPAPVDGGTPPVVEPPPAGVTVPPDGTTPPVA